VEAISYRWRADGLDVQRDSAAGGESFVRGVIWHNQDIMVDLSVTDGKLVIRVEGADKLWALKSSLEIPLEHVAEVRADPAIARGWWHGLRMPGTNIPGVITAGTFYQHGEFVFWDVHDPEKTVVISLRDERYGALVVEVEDAEAAVRLVHEATGR
jgi:hypothetical protein